MLGASAGSGGKLVSGRAGRRARPGLVALAALLLAGMLTGGARVALGQTPEAERSLIAPLAPRSLLLDVATVGERLVAVGERGHILLSDDSGVTWRQVEAPTTATLTGVCFAGKQAGWAVGHDAVILRTRDAGASWERVHADPGREAPFFDVYFTSLERGFAIGAYGLFMASEDGGASWQERRISEDDFHLHHVARSGTGTLYIAAEAGTIYRSRDGGATWKSLPSPYEGSLFATLPLAGDSLLLLGLRGHLYRSEDAGESWSELASGTEAMLTDAAMLKDGAIVVAGLAGTVLVSVDSGRTFTLRQQASRLGSSALAVAPDGALVLVGEGGARRLARTDLGLESAERKATP